MRTRYFTAFIGMAACVALGACATTSTHVRVDQAADADLSKCRTFDWLPASSEATSFTEQRVRDEALKQLQEKGYTVDKEKPDCRITYALATREQPKPKPRVGVGAGGGSGGVVGGIGVSLPIGRKKQEHAGTFALDVIDADKKAQIWSGSFDAVFDSDQLSPEDARDAVHEVLAKFPDRATADHSK